MAVLAEVHITITKERDVQAVYWFYLLQSSTATAPTKPTVSPDTLPASSDWTLSEPTYTEGSTNSLYIVEGTLFTDGTWAYSEVSLSSSYEAAKTAYNKAVNANQTASEAKDTADSVADNLANNYYDKTDMDSSMQVLQEGIFGKVEATYTSKEDLTEAKDALEKSLEEKEKALSDKNAETSSNLADTNNEFAAFKAKVEGMLSFALDDNGAPTLTIQSIINGIAAPHAMKMQNTGYSVEYEGTKVSYLDKTDFVAPRLKSKELTFAPENDDGSLGTATAGWILRQNGHLTLKNLGG